MIGQLEINGYRVDLNARIPFPITYSIADVKNPEKRARSRSKTVDLPGTQRNMDLFTTAFQLTLSPDNGMMSQINFDPTARTVARYYFGSLLVFDGLVKLNKVVIDKGNYTFNITLYSNIVNIIKDLGKLKVKELDWSIYNHRLTREVVELSWNTSVNLITDGSGDPDNGTQTANFSGAAATGFANGLPQGWGYCYPVVEYGYPRAAQNEFKTGDLLPMLYVRDVFHRILSEQFDLEVVSEFMDTEQFRRLLIGIAPGEKFELTEAEILERRVSYQSNYAWGSGIGFPSNTPSVFSSSNPHVVNPTISSLSYKVYYYFEQSYSRNFLLDNPDVALTLVTDDLGQVDEATGQVTIQRTGNYNFTLQGTMRARLQFTDEDSEGFTYGGTLPGAPSGSLNREFRIAIRRNGEYINIYGGGGAGGAGIQINNLTPGNASNDNWVEFVFNKTINLDVQVGDVIEFLHEAFIRTTIRLDIPYGGSPQPPFPDLDDIPDPPTMSIEIDTTNGVNVLVEAQDGALDDNDPIEMSRFAPEMTCAEFLRGIILAFNLYVDDPDMVNGTIKMEPLQEYYKEDVEAIDWTDKVDHSKKFEILPASTIEGETYAFNFKPDTDYDNNRYRSLWGFGYGNREYQVPSTFVKGVRAFDLPFAISVPVRLRTVPGASPSDITSIIAPRIVSGNPYAGDIEPHKGDDRLYVYNGLVELPDDPQEFFRLTDISDPNNFEDFTAYPNVNHQNSLTDPTFDLVWAPVLDYWETWNGVQTNVNLWIYHSKFIRELTLAASAIVRCYVTLKPADIYSLDFARLIKINGVLFRLNEVKDWDPNSYQSARVELLKVIELNNLNTGNQTPES